MQTVHHTACQMHCLTMRPSYHPTIPRRPVGVHAGREAGSRQDATPTHAQPSKQHLAERSMGALMTTVMAASLLMGSAPAVRAETAYEKRTSDMARRREQLASVREKALSKGGAVQDESAPGTPQAPPPKSEEEAPPAAAIAEPAQSAAKTANSQPIPSAAKPTPASEPTPASKEPPQLKAAKVEREKSPPMTKQQDGQSVQDLIKASIGDYESFTKSPSKPAPASSPSTSAPAPKAEQPKPAEAAKSIFQQRPSTPAPAESPANKFPNAKAPSTPTPAPAPFTPSPPPALKAEPAKPAFTPGPRPQEAAKKLGAKPSAAVQAPSKGRGKQKGPLPMTIAQLVVLGIFGGIGYAFTVKAEQSATLVQAAVDTLISVYQKLESQLKKNSKALPLAEKRTPSGTDAVQPEA